MNEEADKRNQHQKKTGKKYLVKTIQKITSGNVLGELYWWLTVGRKDTSFGVVILKGTLRRKHL